MARAYEKGDAKARGEIVAERASEIPPKDIRWLWERRIAFGKATLLEGDANLGKSTLLVDLAARLSTGRAFPDGSPCPVGNTLIFCDEDDASDTIVPRLIAAGADLTRVFIFKFLKRPDGEEVGLTINEHTAQIKEAVVKYDAALVVVDPLDDFLGMQIDSYKTAHARHEVMAPLGRIASETGDVARCSRSGRDPAATPPRGPSVRLAVEVGAPRTAGGAPGRPRREDGRIPLAAATALDGLRPPAAGSAAGPVLGDHLYFKPTKPLSTSGSYPPR